MKVLQVFSALILTLGVATAHAAPTVSLSALGQLTSTVEGATTIDFNSGCGYVTCSGDYQIVSGSVSGQYAQPAGTNTPYLSVPNPKANGSATFTLGTTSDYFGLYWGSIDSYNSISFFLGGNLVGNFSGTDLVGQFANGNQVNYSSNRFINFDFGSGGFDSVKLTSNGFAFESDNHAFRMTSVPEPAAAILMFIGLLGLVFARQRQR
jgi:hypothetical protein